MTFGPLCLSEEMLYPYSPSRLLALENTIKIRTVFLIRIRIDLAVLDPDPDPGAWKFTKINK
jgi:hypothetical protein